MRIFLDEDLHFYSLSIFKSFGFVFLCFWRGSSFLVAVKAKHNFRKSVLKFYKGFFLIFSQVNSFYFAEILSPVRTPNVGQLLDYMSKNMKYMHRRLAPRYKTGNICIHTKLKVTTFKANIEDWLRWFGHVRWRIISTLVWSHEWMLVRRTQTRVRPKWNWNEAVKKGKLAANLTEIE